MKNISIGTLGLILCVGAFGGIADGSGKAPSPSQPAPEAEELFSVEPSTPVSPGEPLLEEEAALPEEPFVWPLAGRKSKIASGFGSRKAPETLEAEPHEGIDIGAPTGAPVRAAKSGKVLFAGFSKMYASRKDKKEQHHLIIIRHADGHSSRYVHLNVLKVRPGETVTPDTVLGTVSESDEWTEPVLHFEIRDPKGKAVNPIPLLEERSVP